MIYSLTSFVLGLGVFGLVDVTVDGTGVALFTLVVFGGVGCFNVFCGFRAILNEFSFMRPFKPNCIDSDVWFGTLLLFVVPEK